MTTLGFLDKKRRGGILKVILIIMGSLAFLAVLALIGAGWYGKKKLDEAGGMQGFATKMLAKGVEALKPALQQALPQEDKERFNEALARLQQQGASLSPEQIEEIGRAIQKLSENMRSGVLSEADAKTFVDEFSAATRFPATEAQ